MALSRCLPLAFCRGAREGQGERNSGVERPGAVSFVEVAVYFFPEEWGCLLPA